MWIIYLVLYLITKPKISTNTLTLIISHKNTQWTRCKLWRVQAVFSSESKKKHTRSGGTPCRDICKHTDITVTIGAKYIYRWRNNSRSSAVECWQVLLMSGFSHLFTVHNKISRPENERKITWIMERMITLKCNTVKTLVQIYGLYNSFIDWIAA